MTEVHLPDPSERADLGGFTARVVRLDPAAAVRLRAANGLLTVWAVTPFEALATRSVHGEMRPDDITVPASALLAALTVERAERVEVAARGTWTAELPPERGWAALDEIPAAEVDGLSERGLVLARENAGPMGPPAALLDQTVLTVQHGSSAPVKVPMRCLLALSAMGFTGEGTGAVRVAATGSWLRLDARFGAVVRRRLIALPLLT